jgi:hypothetical protein
VVGGLPWAKAALAIASVPAARSSEWRFMSESPVGWEHAPIRGTDECRLGSAIAPQVGAQPTPM